MVPTKTRSSSPASSPPPPSSSSVEVAPPKKPIIYTRRTKTVCPSSSRKRKNCHPDTDIASSSKPDVASSKSDLVEDAAPPKTPKLSSQPPTKRPDLMPPWLPSGWGVVRYVKANRETFTVYEETATRKKFYSKPEVLNYIAIANSSNSEKTTVNVAPPKEQVSTISTKPLEIPKKLYDLIQKVAKLTEALKLNPNNRFAKSKFEEHEPLIDVLAAYYESIDQLPIGWEYDPETFSMAHVSMPPTPPKPKPKPKPKKKKKIKITWSSYNYHGSYPMNKDQLKVWNLFRITDETETNDLMQFPYEKHLHAVDDVMVINILGEFAVKTFNKSCQLYVNIDEDNQVSGAEFMECKFYKLPSKYIFYMTIEAIEQGKCGVYETRVECVTKNGEMTLQKFVLTEHEPKCYRPWVKPRLESKFEYETVQDGSSDPQDFYPLTGMVHRLTEGAGFNYHNPEYSPHLLIYCPSRFKNKGSFKVNVSKP